MPEWTLEKIKQLISNQVQEHLHLEYKAADALAKTDSKKAEITKDISAMANSDGGIIVYGVKEFREKNKEHLPENIDPVNQVEYSKEWIEQIIKTIRPRIEGIIITPVSVSHSQVIYIVEIPKSDTAHQARDDRYHKRYNFTTSHMEDYEIRDVMNRNKNPQFDVSFMFLICKNKHLLNVKIENTGAVYAKYVNVFIHLPRQYADTKDIIIDSETGIAKNITLHLHDNMEYFEYYFDNTIQDKSGNNHFGPILPGCTRKWSIAFYPLFRHIKNEQFSDEGDLMWRVYADNAPVLSGRIALKDIKIISRRPHA